MSAVLPQMPGGADLALPDLELMARLAPDVLLLRQDLGCAPLTLKQFVQRYYSDFGTHRSFQRVNLSVPRIR